MSNKLTGEFDDDFLAEVNAMSPPVIKDDGPLTTVLDKDYDMVVMDNQHEIAQTNRELSANKRKTYLTSEIPVRPCTKDCPNRLRCRDYVKGRVSDGDLCKPELRQIKKWQVAFRQGNLDKIKDDAGAVAGALSIQIYRLLEQAIIDGAIVDSVKQVIPQEGTDEEGKPREPILITEKKAHPALQQAANICKTLGISLNDFLMTPKSAKDTPPQTQINIGISADQVQMRFAARYGQAPNEDE